MTIYQNKTGRVALDKHTFSGGHYFTVYIAGANYGPFNWTEALEWYQRHKSTEYSQENT